MAATPANHRYPTFRISIDKLFTNWQALQLAIENGQGGSYGAEIGVWLRQAVEDFFYQNDNLDGDEVAEFIAEIMNQELDTIVDDNSLEALGETLVQHFKLAASGNVLELQELCRKIDESAAQPRPKSTKLKNDDDSSENESEDEDMEVDEPPTLVDNNDPNTSSSNSAGPSNHRTRKNFVSEPDDDGWVTVAKSKKH